AEQFRSTPARAALAWLSSRPTVTAPIASATSLEQLGDLIEATRLELDAPAIELLNQASSGRRCGFNPAANPSLYCAASPRAMASASPGHASRGEKVTATKLTRPRGRPKKQS